MRYARSGEAGLQHPQKLLYILLHLQHWVFSSWGRDGAEIRAREDLVTLRVVGLTLTALCPDLIVEDKGTSQATQGGSRRDEQC